jgi:hypothetical protein
MRNVPTPIQYQALIDYAAANGFYWKHKLSTAWMNGTDTPLLRQIRNEFGPGWLTKFKLRTYRLEQISEVAKHYILAAIWADAPEGTQPRASQETQEEAFRQCAKFIMECGPLFDAAMARFERGYGTHPDAGSAEAAFGHDFWLTRQGHGVGFWDRKELGKELGQALTDAAHARREANYEFYRGWFYLRADYEAR